MPEITVWNGTTIPRLGLGCWAIGGPFYGPDGSHLGWGEVDDSESVSAIRRALELGVRFFDTADVYGAGHSEQVLGRALRRAPDDVIVASKFGNRFDPVTKTIIGRDAEPAYVRQAVEASLKRLRRERIDLYQLHIDDLDSDAAAETLDCLQSLRRAGKIDAFGWSTDYVDRAREWVGADGFVAVQHKLNLFTPAPELLSLCESHDLLSVNRAPLAMGLLTGKYDATSNIGPDDIRTTSPDWLEWFEDGRPAARFLERLDETRDDLRAGGRTLTQGAIGWIWGQSPQTLPIPGFRNVAQVEDTARALDFGVLPSERLHAQTTQ